MEFLTFFEFWEEKINGHAYSKYVKLIRGYLLFTCKKFLPVDTCKLEARNLRPRYSDLGPQDPSAGRWPRGRKQEGKGVDRTVLPALAFPAGRMWSLSLECGWPLLQGRGSEWPPPSKPPLWLGSLALGGTGVSSPAPFLSNPL